MGRRITASIFAPGTQIHRWTILAPWVTISGVLRYPCRCKCGTERLVGAHDLDRGVSKSCGCYQKDHPSTLRHGHARKDNESAEYGIWQGIKKRCLRKKCKAYKNYGGRGIKICDRWLSFELFLADVGLRPTPLHEIERMNNDGDYEPHNVRWATCMEQNNNKRSNHYITFDGRTQTMAQWARELGINYYKIANRLNVLGWTAERAFQEDPTSASIKS